MRTAPSYQNFDVLLERSGEDVYRARVVYAPAGQGALVTFAQPFAPLELENFLLRIGRPRRLVRSVDAPETKAIKHFGDQLYRALFHDDLRVSLERSLSEAAAKGTGLRLRLRLADTPKLAELPWEFLYDKTRNGFVCLSDRTPLVRFLEVPDPPRPLAVSPPLRILVMISSPHDPLFAQLDVEQEWTKLRGMLGGLERAGLVRLERLDAATLGALRQRLRRDDWHVLHFIGHGGFDPHAQDGVLVLEDPATGGSRLVTAQALGVPLHNHDPLRLVVLNACEGARADPTDPFAGTAQTLIQQGIPAVVAMQFEITDPAAIAFTSELYGAVADGYPLDAALSQARQAIYTDVSVVEWATPVLYLRAEDGRIFDVAPTPPAAIPRELADLNRALELEPNAWAYMQRGAMYRDLKRFDKALADFDRALELVPNNASALRHRGLTYRMTGRKDLALADFNRAVELEPDNAWGFWERGTTRYALKPTEEALADFDRALELEPNSAPALRHRGSFWRKQGRYEKALADLDRALELEPNSAWAHTERGATYRALKRYKEALTDFDRAVDLDPTYAWALRERAAIGRIQSR